MDSSSPAQYAAFKLLHGSKIGYAVRQARVGNGKGIASEAALAVIRSLHRAEDRFEIGTHRPGFRSLPFG